MTRQIKTRNRQSGSVLFWILVIPLLVAVLLILAAIIFHIKQKGRIVATEPDSSGPKYIGEDYGVPMLGPGIKGHDQPIDFNGLSGYKDTERNADPAQESSPETEKPEPSIPQRTHQPF